MWCQLRSPLLPALLLFFARIADTARMMDPTGDDVDEEVENRVDWRFPPIPPSDDEDEEPALFFGHHEGHKKHHKRCLPQFQAVSGEELGLIKKLMTVHDPEQLGKGKDVTIREGGRTSYNGLEVVAAWKVDSSHKPLHAYTQRRDELNSHRSGEHWVYTAQDDAVTQSRQRGLLGDNEYWMLHGGPPSRMESEICHGATWPSGQGAFGEGVYMADEVDKMDQYVQLDHEATHLKAIVGETLDEQTSAAVQRQGGLYVGYVTRAYLGLEAQVQVQKGHHDNTWYWYNPDTEQSEVVTHKGGFGLNKEKPPFTGTTFDSVKVMCSRNDKAFKNHFDKGFNAYFPKRYNEYLVPSSERLAIQYLVAYERVNN